MSVGRRMENVWLRVLSICGDLITVGSFLFVVVKQLNDLGIFDYIVESLILFELIGSVHLVVLFEILLSVIAVMFFIK